MRTTSSDLPQIWLKRIDTKGYEHANLILEQVFRYFIFNLEAIMTTINQMKCACDSCLCVVDVSTAIQKENQYYCSDACADGHASASGCGHAGCNCHS